MVVFYIGQSYDGIYEIRIKNGRYSVFQSPNGDSKIQFLIENTTGTVFIQKLDYGIYGIIGIYGVIIIHLGNFRKIQR